MDAGNLLGLAAGALTTIAFIPQLSKTCKSKCADDVSLAMMSIFCTGVFLWLLYGLWIQALANLVTFVLAALILVLKIKYARALKQKS